jgi:hypothetical protein
MRRIFLMLAVLPLLLGVATVAGGQEVTLERFLAPGPDYSPVPIWWWSGDSITKAGITTQLERMQAGKIYNVIILNLAPSGPLFGSQPDDPPFLSEEWWALFAHAVRECERLGMRLWFYDQLGFSGAGLQARLVRETPAFRGVQLRRIVQDVAGPATVTLETPPAGTALAAFTARHAARQAAAAPAHWIAAPGVGEGESTSYFRRSFHLLRVPAAVHVNITADNGYRLFVNGEKVGEDVRYEEAGWQQAERYDIAPYLRPGKNVFAVELINLGGPGGLLMEVMRGDGALLMSDAAFRVAGEAAEGWMAPAFDDTAWPAAEMLGAAPLAPWHGVTGLESVLTHPLGTPIEAVTEVSSQIAGGSLTLQVPEGQHRAMLFYTEPGGFDYHNPEAGAALIDIVHGEMARRFGGYMGSVIAGSFQDEFPAQPHFSVGMPAVFQERMGYDLVKRLPALYDDVTDAFGDGGPGTVQVRCDANDIAALLSEEGFFIPLHQWHEERGLLCGYDQTVRNADPIRGEQYYVDYFKTQRHYSVPGQDMDGHAKPHQSIADLYERPRVWMEAFHSSGWGQTIEETAVLLHPWVAQGTTLFNPHAVYYSIHGSYWEWAPPDTGWRQPYFAHYGEFSDYVARLSYLLSSGSHAVRVALVHPANTVHAHTGFNTAGPAVQAAHGAYWAVQEGLMARGIDYIIIDEDSIARGVVAEGKLSVGSVTLDTFVMPGTRVIDSTTATQLNALLDTGGTVVMVGAQPEVLADATRAVEAVPALDALKAKALAVTDAAVAVDAIAERVLPVVAEGLPALERRDGDRRFFFVLSDTGTRADGHARYAINDRELWTTPAAKGETMTITLPGDGLPEIWNAVDGSVRIASSYQRTGNETLVQVDLSATPAPILALRPANAENPLRIESDLEITSLSRDGDALDIKGLAPKPKNGEAAPGGYNVRVAFADAVFEGQVTARQEFRFEVNGPFACLLEQTLDNSDGSFDWPPYEGAPPVESRAFQYQVESEGADTTEWTRAAFDDSAWERVLASFGPRAEWTGPVALPEGATLGQLETAPEAADAVWQPAVYSLRLGINEDPVFASALGGKGRIPEEFIDLGTVPPGEVYLVKAVVIVPEMAAGEGLAAVLRVGGAAHKRAFLNGAPVALAGEASAYAQEGTVSLAAGANTLTLAVAKPQGGRLRLYYQFLPPGESASTPEWIWSREASPSARTRFTSTLTLPEDAQIEEAGMVAALGDLHQIDINGVRIADQGNFDAYFMSRAEFYDIASALKPGENTLSVVARDTGHPTGLLLDGLVTLASGEKLPFMSGPAWMAVPDDIEGAAASPVHVLAGPAQGYMGDPAMLRLWARPHPLPHAGWLGGQPPPKAPISQLTFARGADAPPPAWYRFRLPPGATGMQIRLAPGARATLHLGTFNIPLRPYDDRWVASLPMPEAEHRVAALRIESVPGYEAGAAILAPVTFDVGEGIIPLGSWDELGLPHYAGGLVYETQVYADAMGAAKWTLDLGRVRGTVALEINGEPVGVRLWHPYTWDVTNALIAGDNAITLKVYNTLGPHFGEGHPSQHVYKGHTKSGIFGPITLTRQGEYQTRLVKTGS